MTVETQTNISLMGAAELELRITQLDETHRSRLRALRALWRVLVEEEKAQIVRPMEPRPIEEEKAKGGNDESA